MPELLATKVAEGYASPLYESSGGDPKKLTAGAIDAAAAVGDSGAQAVWHDVCEHLSRAIGAAVTLFNPRVLVLGGGVLVSAPGLKKMVSDHIGTFAARPSMRNLRITGTKLADDAGVIGAALLATQPSA